MRRPGERLLGIIGIIGKARSGKSTAAEILRCAFETVGKKATVRPIADGLKKLVPPKPNETKEDWRPRLIEQGAFLNQRYGAGYLVSQVLDRVEELDTWVIVPDIRRPAEYERVVAYQEVRLRPVILRLTCPDSVRRLRFDPDPQRSESMWIDYLNRSAGDETESGLSGIEAPEIIEIDSSEEGPTLSALCGLVQALKGVE